METKCEGEKVYMGARDLANRGERGVGDNYGVDHLLI
jgi:hypothetical protein